MPESASSRFQVALVGNPNTGKTTLFNMLTGLSQRTGNFPGCTVEKKTGTLHLKHLTVDVIDLPGTYSLAALSPDELVVAETLLHLRTEERPVDAILVVVDASSLYRNLYLVHQLRELNMPMVIALNMMDLAVAKGLVVDVEALEKRLGVPVVPTHAGGGALTGLKAALEQVLQDRPLCSHRELFPLVRAEAEALTQILNADPSLKRSLEHILFRALIDEEGTAARRLLDWGDAEFPSRLAAASSRLRGQLGRLIDLETRTRYAWVREVVDGVVTASASPPVTLSERLDKVLTHPFLGLLTMVILLTIVFQSIYSWAAPIMDGIDSGVALVGDWLGAKLAPGMLQSLLVNGVIGGVGGVLVFLPQIIFLFAFLAILEDCGYMARAAFLMDRLFKGFGLSGKSLIPMLSSFACAVPGLMATRTIEDRRDRITTILVAPFMSCSARLPVYAIMIAAFVPARKIFGPIGSQGLTLLFMYSVGILAAVPTAWLLKRTLLRGESPPFLMELPSYKMPSPRTVAMRVFLSGREFLMRAGTTILAVSILIWALAYFPRSQQIAEHYAQQREALVAGTGPQERQALAAQLAQLDRLERGDNLRQSFLGRMGHAVEPLVQPLGWDWRIGMAALASFPAREIVVATLGVIFNLGAEQDENSTELRETLRAAQNAQGRPLFNLPVALSIMVFFALCAQCVATLAVIKKETLSWRYPLLSFGYMTTVAYLVATTVFQVTRYLGW